MPLFKTYILLIENKKEKKAKIGRLGRLEFRRGKYLYVGSGRQNLKARINRYLSKRKNIFWHIDYFLESGDTEIKKIWISQTDECQIARVLSRYGKAFERFGCSDCKCNSHFFYVKNLEDIKIGGKILK